MWVICLKGFVLLYLCKDLRSPRARAKLKFQSRFVRISREHSATSAFLINFWPLCFIRSLWVRANFMETKHSAGRKKRRQCLFDLSEIDGRLRWEIVLVFRLEFWRHLSLQMSNKESPITHPVCLFIWASHSHMQIIRGRISPLLNISWGFVSVHSPPPPEHPHNKN